MYYWRYKWRKGHWPLPMFDLYQLFYCCWQTFKLREMYPLLLTLLVYEYNPLLTFDHHYNYICKHSGIHRMAVGIWNTLYHFRKYIQCCTLQYKIITNYQLFSNSNYSFYILVDSSRLIQRSQTPTNYCCNLFLDVDIKSCVHLSVSWVFNMS